MYVVFHKQHFKTSESENIYTERFSCFCAKSVIFLQRFAGCKNRMFQQQMRLISSWLLGEVFVDLCFEIVSK